MNVIASQCMSQRIALNWRWFLFWFIGVIHLVNFSGMHLCSVGWSIVVWNPVHDTHSMFIYFGNQCEIACTNEFFFLSQGKNWITQKASTWIFCGVVKEWYKYRMIKINVDTWARWEKEWDRAKTVLQSKSK